MVRRAEEHGRERRVVRIGFDTDMQYFQHTARQVLHHVFAVLVVFAQAEQAVGGDEKPKQQVQDAEEAGEDGGG